MFYDITTVINICIGWEITKKPLIKCFQKHACTWFPVTQNYNEIHSFVLWFGNWNALIAHTYILLVLHVITKVRFVPTIIKASYCVFHVASCNFLLYTVQLPAYSIFVLINMFWCLSCHHQCLESLVWVATQHTGGWQCNNLNKFKTLMMTLKTLKQFCRNTDAMCWQLDYMQLKIIKAVDQECEQAPGTWAN